MDKAKRVENIFVDITTVPARAFKVESQRIAGLREAVLNSGDPDSIHDLRIAIRVMRTSIRLFWALFSQEARLLDSPLQDLFHRLGAVRTVDLAIAATCKFSDDVRLEILERLSEQRRFEKKMLLDALSSGSVLDCVSAISTPVPFAPSTSAASAVKHPIWVSHRQAAKSLKRISMIWDPVEVHRLRRRIKRLRYAAEFYRLEYGEDAKAYVKGLTSAQDDLGKWIDLVSLSDLFSRLDKVSRPAAMECRHQAALMAVEAQDGTQLIRTCAKHLSGKSWLRLKERLLAPKKSLAL